jgi:hypothetical protein
MPGHGWRPPDPGFITINTDAAIKREYGKGGAGGVARSSNSFLGAWCKPYPGVTDPFIAEAMAVRDGVIFASLRGFSNVIVETDCSEVANLWTTRHDSRSVVAPILLEIGELSGSFISFDIRHIVRSANGPAHICACWLTVRRTLLSNKALIISPAKKRRYFRLITWRIQIFCVFLHLCRIWFLFALSFDGHRHQ